MTIGQDESVATEPLGISGIVSHPLLKEEVGNWSKAHCGARVAIANLLHTVHCKAANCSYGFVIKFCP